MRKGKVKIEPVKIVKPGDSYYEIDVKKQVTVFAISGGVVEAIYSPNNQILRTQSSRLRRISIVDIMTSQEFVIRKSQKRYIYELGQDAEVNFDVEPEGLMTVFLKDEESIANIKKMNTLAMGYGEYVARRKSIGKGVVNFFTWYANEVAV